MGLSGPTRPVVEPPRGQNHEPRVTGRVSAQVPQLYVAAVTFSAAVVIAATFLHADWAVFSGAKPAAVAIFAVLLVVGEARPLKWLRLNDGGELTASWSFALAILLLDAPAAAILMMAVASVVGDSIHRKPLMRTVFNASQITLALAVAVTLLDLFGEDDRLSSGRAARSQMVRRRVHGGDRGCSSSTPH